ncbi:MAG TPA: GMC family oxidoreductase N-terminal domain-containing protein [Stellaceae bacterium]|nr:GMC family oxidoreductase N-terminal domain-containing protein [Stellaceae bacterium]
MSERFDYVIVGAGSAGCLLADRLSAPGFSVCVLEAGGADRDPLIHVPIGIGRMHKRRLHDWGYDTEIEPGLAGRAIESMRGKVVGGSSSINVMTHVRGNRGDYDRWAANGCPGWSYDEVLPYFRRYESWEGGKDQWRGGLGPLTVSRLKTEDPFFDALLAAAEDAGFPVTPDYNGASQDGFARGQTTIRDGRRCSAAVAFLRPALARGKVTLHRRALVTRVLMAGPRAAGVTYRRSGATHEVFAEREVILSAGVFNTPQVLMLSGIGPADHLRQTGIAPIVDLPGVGGNLQDHLAVTLGFVRRAPGPFHGLMRADRAAVAVARAYLFGTGPATVLPGGVTAFLRTRPDLAVPDIQLFSRGTALDADLWFPGLRPAFQDGFSLTPVLLHPEARGRVLLRSDDPGDKVRIVHNFLAGENDLRSFRAGVRIARDVAQQKPLDPFRGAEKAPGPAVADDAAIDAWIRRTARSAHHPSCTCAMGTGADAVLDPELRVRGVDGLRVVDAAAMPDLVTGNINGCVLMIAEKAADAILGGSRATPSSAQPGPVPRSSLRA